MHKELVDKMKEVLADSFAFYLKAHNFHWNVEGPNFVEYHKFFGDLYDEVHDAIDDIAEQIRQLDAYAPGSLRRFAELSSIVDEYNIPSAIVMCSKLYEDNQKVIDCLTEAYKMAEEKECYALSNFLQDRIQAHMKHRWMLKSITKG